MRLFNVYNTTGRRGWIVAASEERAIDLALTHGWARKRENLRVNEDTFPYVYQGLEDMLNGPEGIASVLLNMHGAEYGQWKVYPFD